MIARPGRTGWKYPYVGITKLPFDAAPSRAVGVSVAMGRLADWFETPKVLDSSHWARVLAGQDPATGAQLRHRGGRSCVAAYQLAFSTPPWLAARVRPGRDGGLAEAFRFTSQLVAVGSALEYLEDGCGAFFAICHIPTASEWTGRFKAFATVANYKPRARGWRALDGWELYCRSVGAGELYLETLERVISDS